MYGADGTKLRTTHTISGTVTTTNFCSDVIYENGTAKLLLTEEGYVSLSNSKYHYYLKDHQGNNRVVVNQSGSVEETNHYYPFGGVFASTGNTQPYKYNGKEFDSKKGLNWYDYGARMYDPALGRFTTVDPMAEKYYSISPYAYVGNNPVLITDPTGMDWYQDENKNVRWNRSQNKVFEDEMGNKWKNIGENYLYANSKTATLFQQHKNKDGELTLSASTYNLGYTAAKNKLTSDIGSILGTSSTLAGTVGSLAADSKASFRIINGKGGLDFKLYGNGWSGNQWVKTAKVANIGNTLQRIGRLTGLLNTGISAYQFIQAKTINNKVENGLDMFMSGMSFVPEIGAGLSLYWTFGGKQLHHLYMEKVLIPQIKMGLNPGLPAYQPFK